MSKLGLRPAIACDAGPQIRTFPFKLLSGSHAITLASKMRRILQKALVIMDVIFRFK